MYYHGWGRRRAIIDCCGNWPGWTDPIVGFTLGLSCRYIFNLNSSTLRTCRQIKQKVSKVTSLLYSFSNVDLCSPFAGECYPFSIISRNGVQSFGTRKGIVAHLSSWQFASLFQSNSRNDSSTSRQIDLLLIDSIQKHCFWSPSKHIPNSPADICINSMISPWLTVTVLRKLLLSPSKFFIPKFFIPVMSVTTQSLRGQIHRSVPFPRVLACIANCLSVSSATKSEPPHPFHSLPFYPAYHHVACTSSDPLHSPLPLLVSLCCV